MEGTDERAEAFRKLTGSPFGPSNPIGPCNSRKKKDNF